MNKFIDIFKPNRSRKFNNLLNLLGIRYRNDIYKHAPIISNKPNNKPNNNTGVDEIYLKSNNTSDFYSGGIIISHILYEQQTCISATMCGGKVKNKTYTYLSSYNANNPSWIIKSWIHYVAIPTLNTKNIKLNGKDYKITNYEDFVKECAISLNKSIDEVKEQFVEITAEEFWNQYENWV